jgi:hypothetical protein
MLPVGQSCPDPWHYAADVRVTYSTDLVPPPLPRAVQPYTCTDCHRTFYVQVNQPDHMTSAPQVPDAYLVSQGRDMVAIIADGFIPLSCPWCDGDCQFSGARS